MQPTEDARGGAERIRCVEWKMKAACHTRKVVGVRGCRVEEGRMEAIGNTSVIVWMRGWEGLGLAPWSARWGEEKLVKLRYSVPGALAGGRRLGRDRRR